MTIPFMFDGNKYSIHQLLSHNLNSLVYNIKSDWDFVIIITGDRTPRVGKSVLAQQIAAYLTQAINKYLNVNNKFDESHIYFSSQLMTKEVIKMKPYNVFIYDEGRESLATSKLYTSVQKDMLDYFAECAQLNHIFIIVLSDFFSLAEEVAVARSEMLINVYRKEVKKDVDMYGTGKKLPVVEFTRGNFEFYNRQFKQYLYEMAKVKKKKDYRIAKHNFNGDFPNKYVVDETKYRKKKLEYLMRFNDRRLDISLRARRLAVFRDTIVAGYHKQGKTLKEISKILTKEFRYPISHEGVSLILKEHKLLKELPIEEGLSEAET